MACPSVRECLSRCDGPRGSGDPIVPQCYVAAVRNLGG